MSLTKQVVITVEAVKNGIVRLRADPWFFPPVREMKAGDTLTLDMPSVEPTDGRFPREWGVKSSADPQ